MAKHVLSLWDAVGGAYESIEVGSMPKPMKLKLSMDDPPPTEQLVGMVIFWSSLVCCLGCASFIIIQASCSRFLLSSKPRQISKRGLPG